MPLIMESTFQGLASNQELSLVGLLSGLPKIADKKDRLQPQVSYGAKDERTAAQWISALTSGSRTRHIEPWERQASPNSSRTALQYDAAHSFPNDCSRGIASKTVWL